MIGHLPVSGAILLFPITYIFGDVFTEVYGYSASRRAIWLGFFATALLYAAAAATIAAAEIGRTLQGFQPRTSAAVPA